MNTISLLMKTPNEKGTIWTVSFTNEIYNPAKINARVTCVIAGFPFVFFLLLLLQIMQYKEAI